MGEVGIDRRVISEWILKESGVRIGTGFIWLRIGCSDGCL
jgi:hypothetical protein